MASSNVAEDQRALTLSRRLDWRFLFPDPRLRRVGVIGPASPDLLAALETFSDSVHRLSDTPREPEGDGFDTIVVRGASPSTLALAARFLRPGGTVYAEATRGGASRWLGRSLPTQLAAGARRAGLVDVATHWHWPTFAAATRIVPLDDPTAFSFILTRGRGSARARFLAMLGRVAISLRILHRGAACVSLTGRRADR